MGESLLRITLRAVGRLLTRGVITRETGALMIRSAWAKASFELLPSERTGNGQEAGNMRLAEGNDHWCVRCQSYRTAHEGGLCPSCMDDDRRGRVAS